MSLNKQKFNWAQVRDHYITVIISIQIGKASARMLFIDIQLTLKLIWIERLMSFSNTSMFGINFQ